MNWASTLLGSTIPVRSWESCKKTPKQQTWNLKRCEGKQKECTVCTYWIKNSIFSAFSLFGEKTSSSAGRVQKTIAVESDMVSIRGFKRCKIHLEFHRASFPLQNTNSFTWMHCAHKSVRGWVWLDCCCFEDWITSVEFNLNLFLLNESNCYGA